MNLQNAKWRNVLLIVLLANAAYIAALPSATLFYVANVLLHIVVGVAGVAVLAWQYKKQPLGRDPAAGGDS